MNDTRAMIKDWLMENKNFINYRSLERNIDCPRGALQKWVTYDVEIAEEWIDPLYRLINKIIE